MQSLVVGSSARMGAEFPASGLALERSSHTSFDNVVSTVIDLGNFSDGG
jgi:hypothetical protein